MTQSTGCNLREHKQGRAAAHLLSAFVNIHLVHQTKTTSRSLNEISTAKTQGHSFSVLSYASNTAMTKDHYLAQHHASNTEMDTPLMELHHRLWIVRFRSFK